MKNIKLDKSQFSAYNVRELQVGDFIVNPRTKDEFVEISHVSTVTNFKTFDMEYCIQGKATITLENEDGFRMFYLPHDYVVRWYRNDKG